MVGIQDFMYFVYLFSSHVKLVEKAQLYFKLFDFDNDGKITPIPNPQSPIPNPHDLN